MKWKRSTYPDRGKFINKRNCTSGKVHVGSECTALVHAHMHANVTIRTAD